MGRRGRGGGRGRGRGGGRHGGHDQGEGSGGLGRGRSGGGRQQRQSVNGRGGRAHEGPARGSRPPSFNGRRFSNNRMGMDRPTQSSFASIAFDYTRTVSHGECATSNASSFAQAEMEEGEAGSQDRKVVIPAVEGRVEVYIDRKGCQEALESLDLETRTRGLGFVDQESANCSNSMFHAEDSGTAAPAELICVQDKNVAALEAMKVDTKQESNFVLKTPDYGKNHRFRNKKSRRGSHIKRPSMNEGSSGFLQIGGVRVWADDAITDESEGLDEEPDVNLALDFAIGKKQKKNMRGKKSRSSGKASSQASGVRQRGQWLEDSSSGSEESIVDSSNSDIDHELVEDYMANIESGAGFLDTSWMLKNKIFQQVAIEDLAAQDWEDESDTNTDASGSDDDSSRSRYSSPEKLWRLQRQSKGKELMDNDDESDSELEDMAEKLLLGGACMGNSKTRHGRKTRTALQLRDLELDDSFSDEDEDAVDQLFDIMEDANFMTGKSPKTPGTGKQTSIGKSIDPVAWPISIHKSKKKTKHVRGEKKRERKEMIAAKRKERALCRGLDLQAINSALEGIVVNGTDIYAFAPMEDRDRAQIHRMAAIYRLKSASQGTGKKRFTVVTRTKHTSLPTGSDKYRLASMLGQGDGQISRLLTGEDRRMAKKALNAAHQAFLSMQEPNLKKSGKKHQKVMQAGKSFHKLKKSKKDSTGQYPQRDGGKKSKAPNYVNKPMSFIASGIIGNEDDAGSIGLGTSARITTEIETFSITDKGEASSSRSAGVVNVKVAATSREGEVSEAIGTFEAHTRGFGSRMMSKMGFVEGQGLGKYRQGIASPLEAVKRPKSLGLGAYAPAPT